LNELKVPTLIFSGKKDQITTDAEVKKLKKIKPAITVVNYNGSHMEAFSMLSKDFPGSEYVKYIEHFLKLE
jgi:predicted alpha/beta-hydrolase family hydrolase